MYWRHGASTGASSSELSKTSGAAASAAVDVLLPWAAGRPTPVSGSQAPVRHRVGYIAASIKASYCGRPVCLQATAGLYSTAYSAAPVLLGPHFGSALLHRLFCTAQRSVALAEGAAAAQSAGGLPVLFQLTPRGMAQQHKLQPRSAAVAGQHPPGWCACSSGWGMCSSAACLSFSRRWPGGTRGMKHVWSYTFSSHNPPANS